MRIDTLSPAASTEGTGELDTWWPRIQWALKGMDAWRLVDTVPAEDKPDDLVIQRKAMSVVVSKLGDDPLTTIDTSENLKDMIFHLREQYEQKGWLAKQLVWEQCQKLRHENYVEGGGELMMK